MCLTKSEPIVKLSNSQASPQISYFTVFVGRKLTKLLFKGLDIGKLSSERVTFPLINS